MPNSAMTGLPHFEVLHTTSTLSHCIHLARPELRVQVEAFLQRVGRFSFDMTGAVLLSSIFQCGGTACQSSSTGRQPFVHPL